MPSSLEKPSSMIILNAYKQNFQLISVATLCKFIALLGLTLFVFYTFLFRPPYTNNYQSPTWLPSFERLKWPLSSRIDAVSLGQTPSTGTPTKLNHIVFGIVGSMNTWRHKRAYVEAWWRPNSTRGYVFLDRPPSQKDLPWPSTSPPFQVNEDMTKLKVYPKLVKPVQFRIVRTILETFRQGDKDVRWYVMGDDDTVLFLDNLVDVLAKYDHTQYQYIGTSSECVKSNVDFSFDMAFGGAGIALSYPLVEALSKMLDGCIERYPYLWSSDLILDTCLADIGVAVTKERGFHQIDLHGDISGLLSSHPQTPLLSLHHIDTTEPLFPSMNRSASINHLMKAASLDPSRLLQQTICYQRRTNWTFSVSWGFSSHVYEAIHPRSYLRRPLETFKPWMRSFKPPLYTFNTRWLTGDPCIAPHAFFLESLEVDNGRDQYVATYLRGSPRNLPPCSLSGNHSADHLYRIRVVSPATIRKKAGVMECCDVGQTNNNLTNVKLRPCMKDEIIA